MDFVSKHNLPFETAIHPVYGTVFRVGTCHGIWGSTDDSYYLLSIMNDEKGNGHLDDVFEWFENSCKRDNRNLLVLACMNQDFYFHLIKKRGFKVLDARCDNVIKVFNDDLYKQLIKKGNKMLHAKTLRLK